MRAMNFPRPRLNPIIVRELRTRMRGGRPYAILTVFLLLMTLAGLGIYLLMMQRVRFGSMLLSAQVGQALFKGLAFVELLLVVFLAPAMTSGAISGEREHLTYDMLVATPLRPGQILWGKLFSALSYLFLLIFAAVPVFSVVLVFGGVDLTSLLKTLALLFVSTVTFGAVGLFCSSLLRRTSRATTISYMLVLLLIGVPTLVASVWGQFSTPMGQPPPPQLLYLNPFGSLAAITTVAPTDPNVPFFAYDDPLASLPVMQLFMIGVIWYGPAGVVVMPLYRATLLLYPLLTVLLCWMSAHLMLPSRRWRPRWSDLGFALATAGLVALIWLTQGWWYVAPPPIM